MYYVRDDEGSKDFKEYLKQGPCILQISDNVIKTEEYEVTIEEPYLEIIEIARKMVTVSYIENSGYKFRTY